MRSREQGTMTTIAEIENHLAAFIAAGELDGAALSVAQRGRQVIGWQGGAAAPGRPATARTLWPLASISKSYSAAAIMALVERGVLLLSTPVRALLPQFTGGGKEHATLRHLLTHTAGLIYESPEMERRMAATTASRVTAELLGNLVVSAARRAAGAGVAPTRIVSGRAGEDSRARRRARLPRGASSADAKARRARRVAHER